jgi:hypothetical protein
MEVTLQSNNDVDLHNSTSTFWADAVEYADKFSDDCKVFIAGKGFLIPVETFPKCIKTYTSSITAIIENALLKDSLNENEKETLVLLECLVIEFLYR